MIVLNNEAAIYFYFLNTENVLEMIESINIPFFLLLSS